MTSNIRAKPIEGHITDSSGNVLRNAQIVIKQATPNGSYSIDSINSDEHGFFSSKPIPNGLYDIYEKGVLVSKLIHNPDVDSIHCFKAHRDNYDVSGIKNFSNLAGDEDNDLNEFKAYIQIERPQINVAQYGNTYPIFDYDITSKTEFNDDELWYISQFFNLTSESRITTTRFDVEFFNPLTSLSNSYQRIRWVGVPGIKFYRDSKLVIPLDYFSIVLNHPRIVFPIGSPLGPGAVTASGSDDNLTLTNGGGFPAGFESRIKIGDITQIILSTGTVSKPWYGIISSISATSIRLKKWKSSRFVTEISSGSYLGLFLERILVYDGMFSGILNIDEDVNEKFTVVENIYAQGNESEIYNYTKIT